MANDLRAPLRADAPVSTRDLADGIALCLSGGGFRATVFHLGALWRLNEAGILSRLARISSVSGGSITCAALGVAWERLGWVEGVATRLEDELILPVRRLAGRIIDLPAILAGMALPGSAARFAARLYDRHLFHGATLQDLPDTPRFVINATNVQSGALWRFMKPGMRDWRVGEVPHPKLRLADAVSASAAYPPFLSPMRLRFREDDWSPSCGEELHHPPYTTNVVLTDGAVYDNLGLETVWKRYRTILVSDSGGRLADTPSPPADWMRHVLRAAELIDCQVRFLRKRQVVGSFISGARKGTYWGIGSKVADYGLDDALECPPQRTMELETMPTRLAPVPPELQERLINWGYAICDTALRRWVLPDLPRPVRFPYSRGV